jgi:predicted NBD/HSP70 family sugar kinase
MQSLSDEPGLTRAELARRTGLTKVTISDLVAELIDAGLVAERGTAPSAGPGKPAIGLEIRTDARDIIAFDIAQPATVRIGVYDLAGGQRSVATASLGAARGGDAVAALGELAAAAIANADRPVLGVGIGSPGIVDAEGKVLSAEILGWTDVPLQALLAERLGVPVVVLNDANAAASAERSFGGGLADAIRVTITDGVGAGIMLGGELLIGKSAAAGEIGHVVVEYGGDHCRCGKDGCLETWISVPALNRRLRAGANIGGGPGSRSEILAEAGRRLGMALAPVVAALDVNEVVIGGPIDLLRGVFVTSAADLVSERTHSRFRADTTVRLSALGSEAVLLGAASLIRLSTLGIS